MTATIEQELYSGETVVERARREINKDREELETLYRLMGEELVFVLNLEQYREQGDRTDIGSEQRPLDVEIFRQWRYTKAWIRKNAPTHISAEPRDKKLDPSKAKGMKLLIEDEVINRRWKRYEDTRDRWIGAAAAMRAGAYRWDFARELGKNGEIVSRFTDARALSWPKGFLHPHDPLNPRIEEVCRIPTNQIRRMKDWKHVKDVRPDGDMAAIHWPTIGNTPRGLEGQRESFGTDILGDDEFSTIGMVHYRFEPGTEPAARQLAPDETYMQCKQCKFQTPPLGALDGLPEYPATIDSGCPKCEGTMVRRDTEALTDEPLVEGKKLVIFDLGGTIDEPLYVGNWQCPKARSFPYAYLTRFRFPHMRIPESEVSQNWSVTVARNYTLAAIFRQMHRSRGITLFPISGIVDRNNQDYDPSDPDSDFAYYTHDLPPEGARYIEGAPITTSLFDLYAMLRGAYRENEGTSDIQIAEDRSRDIAVGTMSQMKETGEVSLDDFRQDVYYEESLSFGILADYCSWFYTEEQALRYYNEDGEQTYMMVRASSEPDVDVIVSAGPRMSQVRQEELEAYKGLSELPGPRRRRVAQLMGLDPGLVADMDNDDEETIRWQARMDMVAATEAMKVKTQQASLLAGGGKPQSGGGAIPAPIADRMNGAAAMQPRATEGSEP